MKAVSIVLTLESMMALIACLKPSSTAVRTNLPCCSSSRIRSKISTFASTAMPTESTRPDKPGRVSVKPKPASQASVNSTYSVSAATARHREAHHRLIGHLIAPGRRLLELLAHDAGPVLDRVQRAVGPRAPRRDFGTPFELEPPRDEAPDLGAGQQAFRRRHLLLGHEILARERALEQERGQRPRHVQTGRVLLGLAFGGLALLALAGIRAEQLGDVRRPAARLPGGLHPSRAQRLVDLAERVAEPVLHVGDTELEERGALNDALGARRILFARQLHDQAAPSHDLHHRLGGAELVDAAPHHPLRPLDRIGAVGDGPLALVHFQREVDTALEVEPEVDGNAAHGRVLHAAARGVTHPLGDVLREEEPGGEERQPCDDDQSVANRAHATLYGVRTWRAATASRPIWATSASRDGNVCTSRSRRTHSTVTVSPYSSPAKSNRWISRTRAVMPNVGRGPWFIMPP